MDETRFDALARSLTQPRSRRGLTRLLGGLGVGGPLALFGAGETAAKPKKKKKNKKKSAAALPVSPPPSGCTPDCAGKRCGDANGCGGFCTDCPQGKSC